MEKHPVRRPPYVMPGSTAIGKDTDIRSRPRYRRRYLGIVAGPRDRGLEIVDGGGCGVAAAGRGGPRDGVRGRLGRLPSGSLLSPVVPPAFRVQVALVRG